MLFKLLMLVHFCAAFPLKCPEPAQWTLRANGHCADPSKYFCLKNDLIKGYSENCTRSDFQQPGRKAVLRGGIDAEICSRERFQPFPIRFYTNASTHCIFLKIICNEEGQVVHDHGDRNTDTSCRCDYRRGYTFLVTPKHPCFCKPSQEDCSCYLKTCSNTSRKLSPDYQCMYETAVKKVTQCQPITDKIENRSIISDNRRNILTENNISSLVPRQIRLVITGYSIVLFLLLFIGSLLMYFWIYSLRALEIKGPGQELCVNEGSVLKLKYKLSKEVPLLQFFKDNTEKEKVENVKERFFEIKKADTTDNGEYFAQANSIKSKITKVIVQSMFTFVPDQASCIEGERLQLNCSLRSKSVNVEWSKLVDDSHMKAKIKEEKNISIKRNGKNHVMTLKYAKPSDSGKYSINAKTIERLITVNVTEMFTSVFQSNNCIEGQALQLGCSVYSEDVPVEWFKVHEGSFHKPVKIIENKNISISKEGRKRILKVQCAKMSDSGKYIITAGNVKKQFTVNIKEVKPKVQFKDTVLKNIEVARTNVYTFKIQLFLMTNEHDPKQFKNQLPEV